MQLIFMNPMLKAAYDTAKVIENLSPEETGKFYRMKRLGENEQIFQIAMGYVTSLFDILKFYENNQEVEATLDLTYDTLKHLPAVLGMECMSYLYSGSYSKEKVLEIGRKTLAAYLMCLCMNTHMCMPSMQRMQDFHTIMDNLGADLQNTDAASWMGHTIKVGTNKQIDLLGEVETAIKITPSGVFRVRISRVVEAYRQMCGIDLREMGLDNFECKYEKPKS